MKNNIAKSKNSNILILTPRKLVPIIFILSGLVSSCDTVPSITPSVGMTEPSQTAVADAFTPTLQVIESTPVQISVIDTVELFSSDRLDICFPYPQRYTRIPVEKVEIATPISRALI